MPAKHHMRTRGAALIGLAVCCSLGAGSAQAKSVSVSGTQTVVDEQAGIYRMQGDLVGRWRITSFKELATDPLTRARGTERFRGCLDRQHDGRCAGDPSGTLRLRFTYWAMFDSADPPSLLAGACWHPIVSGTGAMARAGGAIQMLDVQTQNGVETHYTGDIRMRGGATTAARRMCGTAG
jgi:hypothetical protein